MEPLTALALSGNVLQFIDSAGKLIREARQICSSIGGITAGNRDAIAVYDDFRAAASGLAARPLHPRTADDAAVVSLAERCNELSDDLVTGLKRLQSTNPGSKRDSLRVAWRAMRDKGELEELEKRLDRYRQQLMTRLVFMMSEDQSSTYRLLQECRGQGEDSATKTNDHLGNLSNELLDLSRKVEKDSESTASAIDGLQDQVQEQVGMTVKMITDLVSEIITTKEKTDRERQILDKLRFQGMRRRENAIEPAHAGTYRWLLYPPCEASDHESTPSPSRRSSVGSSGGNDDEDSKDSKRGDDVMKALMELRKLSLRNVQSFRERAGTTQLKTDTRETFLAWLESGSGLFYLSGKAGSGKSTMMKFLAHEERTKQGLETWAAGKQLVFASFFFWSSGLGLQRSIEGLYRGLLWETLKTCPELMPAVFPHEWNSNSRDTEFSMSEIEMGFGRLTGASSSLSSHRICFFIDGLDEFEGDHLKLAKLLNQWAASPDVKICVSSRPYSDFENSFATEPGQRIRLHELTEQDMVETALDELKATARHWGLSPGENDYTMLINPAVKKANGVFLWLRLAMRHLVRGIGNAYSISELTGILKSMPEDVSVMFQAMLDRLLARPDKVRVAISLISLSDPSVPRGCRRYVAYFSAMNDVLDGSINLDELVAANGSRLQQYSQDQIERRLVITEARLRGRCEGFIDIYDNPNKDAPSPLRRYIEFVHRDLRDFLLQDHILQRLYKVAGWSPAKVAGLHRYLGIVLLKTLPGISTWPGFVDDLVDDFLCSEGTSRPELELLLALLIRNSVEMTTEGRRKRYCTILAIRDNVLDHKIEKMVHYTKEPPAHPLYVAFEFICAAAFHRHDDYVLRLVTRFPVLLDLDNNGCILLSASLGAAAALATHGSQPDHNNNTTTLLDPFTRPRSFMKTIANSEHAHCSGGIGSLLYPSAPTELFPGPTLDTDSLSYPESSPPARILRTGASPPLTLTQALLDKGASPNAQLRRFHVPAWPGTHWTPWTATLLTLAGIVRRGELLADPLLALAEAFLARGADPTVCFVGRYLPKHKLKPLPVWRVGPGVYASLKLDAHIPTLFEEGVEGDDGGGGGEKNRDGVGRWWYLTLGQVVEMCGGRDRERKKRVEELLWAKSPWKVARWVNQAVGSLGGGARRKDGEGEGVKIGKLELAELGDSYFFVGMIVREQDLGSLVVPPEAKSRLLAASLVPI